MPPQCCRCNGNGRCKGCICVRGGKACTNCTPSRSGRCENFDGAATRNGILLAEHEQPELTRMDEDHLNERMEMGEESAERYESLGMVVDESSPFPNNSIPNAEFINAQSTNNPVPSMLPGTQLPPFEDAASPNFLWGEIDGESFAHEIECCYAEIVHWRQNRFKLPSGNAGKSFVRELSRLFRAFSDCSTMEAAALKAAMVLPALVLQKPHAKSKAKEHSTHLQRRLKLWEKGDINLLVIEGRTIQHQLKKTVRVSTNGAKPEGQMARTFAKLMMEGKVKAALRILAQDSNGGVLPLDSHVLEALKKKHPARKSATPSAVITSNSPSQEPSHFILFDHLDGQMIRKTVLKTEGAAGPSGLDAAAWRRLCTSFQSASTDLCDALASTARRICCSFVDPKSLSAFVACRLIALDKCPGIRPIGIGETARRIIGKAILTTIGEDIKEAAGPLQLCAGQEAGCEAAVHAMRQMFESPNAEAAILVDATNAFNSLNRESALRNIQHLCPSLSTILINTYREDVHLYIDGETMLSQEGTTQGDPLAMAMYAIGILPLIQRLSSESTKQTWYADDAAACGNLTHLRSWWDQLIDFGPTYGYHPNASKTWLIVKEEKFEEATTAFEGTGVSITQEGKRHLGAALGTIKFIESYVKNKVSEWVHEIEVLSTFAATQPHAAYAAFTHGFTSRWTFLARTTPNIGNLLQPLEEAIRLKFLPALTGKAAFSDDIRDLLALPVRLGGLGVTDPTCLSDFHHTSSKNVSAPLVSLILEQSTAYPTNCIESQKKSKCTAHNTRRIHEKNSAIELSNRLPISMKRALEVSKEKGASSWLSALPIAEHGFALHKGAFRDALCLRYGWQPPLLPANCVCGKHLTIEHALSCPCGGFPSIRHNELRDLTAQFLTETCRNVGIEPTLQPLGDEHLRHRTAIREDGARLDIVAENFWGRDRQNAFFDVRVFNPYAQSHRSSTLAQCYRRNEQEKKRSYEERVREVEHGSFSPLIFSTSGGLGPIATVVYKRIASLIAEKRDQPYSRTLFWLRCKLGFSLLRSAIMCIRVSRSSYHHPSRTSGEAIDLICSESRIA